MREPAVRDERPFYLVAAAGTPNYGDEFITRTWLDWLARHRPDVPVWLDCPEPGRANHLFGDAHPLLRTTNTLWHLAFSMQGVPLAEGAERAARYVRDLGTPRLDLGVLALREMRSIHFLGGGYLNSVWEHHLFLVPAALAVKESFGVPVYATGQGLLPLSDPALAHLREWVPRFDFFETRDDAGAQAVGARAGIDDAFLAFKNARPIYSVAESPDTMVLVQGDFVDEKDRGELLDAVEAFVRGRGAPRFGLVEAIPPDDAWLLPALRERGFDVDFYPFLRLWTEGLPAREGQAWLSTRFHFHLLAAAAGAAGATIDVHPDYYSVKHASLRAVGTGWASVDRSAAADGVVPTRNARFPRQKEKLARQKDRVARSLYAAG